MRLKIDKLIYGGEGMARLPPDEHGRGKAVFVPFVLAGETVEAAVTEEKPGFARACLGKIIAPSPDRVLPPCPYFGDCGGCHYQYASYERQLEIKSEILGETLRRIGKLQAPEVQVHPSPPWNYRNRTRMGVRATPGFTLGYRRFGSNQLMAIEQCPISSPLINRAVATLWEVGQAGELGSDVAEIEFFANAEDSQLLMELTLGEESGPVCKLAGVIDLLRRRLPEIAGVAAFRRGRDGALVLEDVPEELRQTFGAAELTYAVRDMNYRVSAGSFFQTNRWLIERLVSLVAEGIAGDLALDLYAGVGLFSVPLSQNFREVAAVEAAPFAFHDLKHNRPSNVSGYGVEVEKFLASLPGDARFDYVVVDPPRSGLGERTARRLGELQSPRLTYVSCDPATLARDLRVLTASGYRFERLHLVDLFPQTFHIETVAQLRR